MCADCEEKIPDFISTSGEAGFSLTLDGPEEHIRRILDAVWAEMKRLAQENAPPAEVWNGGLFKYVPNQQITVRGELRWRKDIP